MESPTGEAIDTWDFDVAIFRPYLGDTIEELTKLLGPDTESIDSKLMVNDTLGKLIERVGAEVCVLSWLFRTVAVNIDNPDSVIQGLTTYG